MRKKYNITYVLSVLLLTVAMVFCACGTDNPGLSDNSSGYADSTVTVPGTFTDTEIPVETYGPGTDAPETTVPETTVPETTVPETTVSETTVPETTLPETTVPETTLPETTVPETTVPETTIPETTIPETTVPETTPSETVAPDTSEDTSALISEPENNGRVTFTLSFAGDVQFADNQGDEKKNFASTWDTVTPAHYLSKVKSIFDSDDYSLVNLEFVLTDRDLEPSAKSGTAYWYKGATKYIEALTCSSIEGVALTNNHIGDYGKEGEADTLACVLSSGLDAGTYEDTIYVEKNGYKVAIICDAMWYSGHRYDILKRLEIEETKSDFQVVYWHGGSKEYQKTPDDWEIEVCHELVDAGADLIIGNHPHVLQPMEYYKGVRILYSLGNFCYSGMMSLNKATVIYQLKLTVGDGGVLLDIGENIIPCYYYSGYLTNPTTGKLCQNFQPAPITDPAAIQQAMDFLNWKADSPMLQ